MNRKAINAFVLNALREDAASHDITTQSLIPAGHVSRGFIVAKEEAVICGLDIAKMVFRKLNKNIRFQTRFKDGAKIKSNTVITTLKGNTRALLTGERTALNFLGYLSGIATRTRRFVEKIKSTKAKLLDTRKTTPGLRVLDKYAIDCGGGVNHRFDLAEFVMIKDNHRQTCGLTIAEAVTIVRWKTKKPIILETDNISQFKQALPARPDIILLDNMSCTQIKKAVALVRKIPKKKRPLLEASGGITLNNVRQIAKTGVDRISVGSLTHTHKGIDYSMELL